MSHFVGMRERGAELWAKWRGLVSEQLASGHTEPQEQLRRVKRRKGRQRDHARGMLGTTEAALYRRGEGRSRDRPGSDRNDPPAIYNGEAGVRCRCG